MSVKLPYGIHLGEEPRVMDNNLAGRAVGSKVDSHYLLRLTSPSIS